MKSVNRFVKFLLATAMIPLLISCGGESATISGAGVAPEEAVAPAGEVSVPAEEAIVFSQDASGSFEEGSVTLQGTVLRFSIIQASDGTRSNAGASDANNYVYLSPFEETFRARHGCTMTSGTYGLVGNSLVLLIMENNEINDCALAGDDDPVNREIARRVLSGASTVSVSSDGLMLTTANNEALIFVAVEES